MEVINQDIQNIAAEIQEYDKQIEFIKKDLMKEHRTSDPAQLEALLDSNHHFKEIIANKENSQKLYTDNDYIQ